MHLSDESSGPPSPSVVQVLDQARAFGFLGPGPVEDHLEHSQAFARLIEERTDLPSAANCLDLGSGGGVPGLVLADRWATTTWTFLDAHQRRMSVLAEAVASLGWQSAKLFVGRAEEYGRDDRLRGQYDLVVARGFSGPAVTAECSAPLLRVGGWLAVSEPPEDRGRWDDDGLARLGLSGHRCEAGGRHFFLAQQVSLCPSTFPRRVGIPGKRPLFE